MNINPPLRYSIPLALAVLGITFNFVYILHDRATSFENVETSTLRRAQTLNFVVVPTLQRCLAQSDVSGADGEITRLAVMPNMTLALLCDAEDLVLHCTDYTLRNRRLNDAQAAAMPLADRARTTMLVQSEVTPDRTAVRMASPVQVPTISGDLQPSRTAVLYTEWELGTQKTREWTSILVRAGYNSALVLAACVLVWFFLRITFTRQLDQLSQSVAAYAEGTGELRVPAAGNHELAKIGLVLNDLLADVTAKQAAIVQSQELFRNAFQRHTAVKLNIDPDTGQILDANDAAVAYYGWPREQLCRMRIQDINTLPADAVQQEMESAFAERRNYFEFRHRRADGSVRDVAVFSSNISTPDKPVLNSIIQDITDRKQAEKALQRANEILEHRVAERTAELRASEERLELAFRAAQDGVWDWNMETDEVFYSARWKAMLGYDDSEIEPHVGEWKRLLHPDDLSRCLEVVAGVIRGEQDYSMEFRMRHKDGHYVDILSRGFPIRREPGGPIVRIVGTHFDLTERKRIQAELERMRDQLAEGQRIAHLGSWEYLVETHRTIWSDEEKRIFGLEPSQPSPDYETIFRHYAHPDDGAGLDRCFREAMQDGLPFEHEWRIVRPDGSVRVLSDKAQPFFDENGNLSHYVGTTLDITEQKLAELLLAEERQRLADIIEASHAGTWEWNVQTGEAIVNLRWAQICGYTLEELSPISHTTWQKLVHPDDFLASEELLQRHFRSELKYYGAETRMKHKDGSWVWVRAHGQVISWTKEGQPLWMRGTHHDITAQKQLEASLREMQNNLERLVESRTAELLCITNAAHDGIIMMNPQGHVTYWNPAAERILGYSSQDAIGRDLHELIAPRNYHADHEAAFPEFTGTDQGDSMGKALELVAIRKDGREISVSLSLSAARLNEEWYSVGILADITERKQAENELVQYRVHLEDLVAARTAELAAANQALIAAKEAAEAGSRAKSTFLANMSHEIRTPLNAILGFAQLLARDRSVNSQQRHHIEMIDRSGQHLLELINAVLEMAKVESGTSEIHLAAFDLHEELGNLEDIFKLRAVAKNLTFVMDRPEDLPRFIVGDKNKLRQILINLLGNAIKFTVTGGVTLRVRMDSSSPGLMRLITEVLDSGAGISAEDIGRLFQPFHQGSMGGQTHEGTGLGLAISREFAELMGGQITVTSRVGEGSVFRLDIPVELTDNKAIQSLGRNLTREYRLASGQQPYRVLVVDDVETNRDILDRILRDAGFEVRQADSGPKALHTYTSWHPHVILLDMRMPGMNGDEVLRRIREPGNPPVKVVFVTAAAFDEERQQAMDLGADDFIAKPYRDFELFEKLQSLLGAEYADTSDDKSASSAVTVPSKLTPGALTALPDELIQKMLETTKIGDFDRLMELIQFTETFDAQVAQSLRELADAFDIERILELLENRLHL